ncbi:MAG: hypothetical protein QW327_06965 [Candidatus Odinarchaeota archaeon]
MVQLNLDDVKLDAARFIIKLNNLYNNYVFTSSRIAQEITKSKNIKITFFPKIHKTIRELLREWSKQQICIFLSQTKLGHSRRTKAIYKFTEHGLMKLKKYLISEAIHQTLTGKLSHPSFPSRTQIINKLQAKFLEL